MGERPHGASELMRRTFVCTLTFAIALLACSRPAAPPRERPASPPASTTTAPQTQADKQTPAADGEFTPPVTEGKSR